MYVLKGATQEHRDLTGSAISHRCELKSPELDARGVTLHRPDEDASADWATDAASDEHQRLIYLDPRALTRDCVGRWLQSRLNGFNVCLLPDPEQITAAPIVSDQIRAVVINAGPERMSSPTVGAPVVACERTAADGPGGGHV